MVSVIIPTFNEKKNINKIIKRLLNIKIISEIIFVDDNSTDGTFYIIKKFFRNKKIKGYLRNSPIRDLSKSVLYGINKSNYQIIVVMDCDLQHDPKYIINMVKKLNNNKSDIVIASRFENKFFEGNLGFFRSFLSNIAIIIINLILGKKSSDPLSGFFVCKKKIVSNHKKFFFKKGYKILFDIIYNGKKKINISHQKIKFKKRTFENSKFNFKVILLFLAQIKHTIFVVKK